MDRFGDEPLARTVAVEQRKLGTDPRVLCWALMCPFPEVTEVMAGIRVLRDLTNQTRHPRHRHFRYLWEKGTSKPNIGPQVWVS